MQPQVTESTDDLLAQLVQAATTMSIMAEKVTNDMDENNPRRKMLDDPRHHMNAVLARCPKAGFKWSGVVEDEHVITEYISAPDQSETQKPRGVRMRHKFLRGGVEMVQKPTREENETRARELLEDRLHRDYPVNT